MRQRGFTLVEVLVAVLILAIALSAVISAMARQADNARHIKEKTIALIVAHNRLAELQLEPTWPKVGRSDGRVEMSGFEWQWETVVKETEDDKLRRIDIEVLSPADEDRGIAQLSGFMAEQ